MQKIKILACMLTVFGLCSSAFALDLFDEDEDTISTTTTTYRDAKDGISTTMFREKTENYSTGYKGFYYLMNAGTAFQEDLSLLADDEALDLTEEERPSPDSPKASGRKKHRARGGHWWRPKIPVWVGPKNGKPGHIVWRTYKPSSQNKVNRARKSSKKKSKKAAASSSSNFKHYDHYLS
jgi:hypothetical protein